MTQDETTVSPEATTKPEATAKPEAGPSGDQKAEPKPKPKLSIDTKNAQAVSVDGNGVLVMFPSNRMTPDEAMVHGAWLMTVAQVGSKLDPIDVLAAVQST